MSETLKNKTQFIRDLKPKESVRCLFAVKHIAVMESRDGKKYLNIILSDNSADVEGRSWSNAQEIASRVSKGDFVQIQGKVNLYNGRKQIIISEIQKIDQSEVDRNDFVVKAQRKSEDMFRELSEIVSNLDDVYIKELLENVLADEEIARRMKLWQAGKTIHHAYEGGLLEHILSCSHLGVSLSAHYKVNKNYVVAGCILHDLCKIYELTDGHNVEYTEEGKLVGHLVKGVEMIDRFAYRIQGFPYDLKMHLKHILLSHHGEYEYGSPKIPQTLEAYLVHLIDYMDSKMNSMESIKRTDLNEGHWSNFVRHLDRIVYKQDLPFYPEKVEPGQRTNSSRKPADPPAKKNKHQNDAPKVTLGDLLKK